jgi:hypothetical protein
MLAPAVLLACGGCAFMEEDNRRWLNLADDAIQPQKPVTQAAMAPVFVPVGVALLATDALVVHPMVRLPDALEITDEVMWDTFGRSNSPFRESMLLVPRIVGTPIAFAVIWGVSSAFAL